MSSTPKIRRFPLHWVFKIGDLEKTISFYTTVFKMKIHRHEEFSSGCEATCNGPYGGAWSKTMVGYGTEITNTSLELTYNFGIDHYELGNDFRYIAIAARGFVLDPSQTVSPVLPGGYQIITSPDGYRFLLVPVSSGCNAEDPFLFISLHVTDLAKSIEFYTELGFTIFNNVPGALNNRSVVLGLDEKYAKLELVQLEKGHPLDHKSAIGRLAIETDDEAPVVVAEIVKASSSGGKIIHGPFKLPPHDEHLVIVADPDGYEYCFVGMTGYRAGSLSVKTNTIDWDYRKKINSDANSKNPEKSEIPDNSRVIHIHDQVEYDKWKATPGKLIVVDFAASWCKPCKAIAPVFEKLAAEHVDVIFLHVDVDENPTLTDRLDVQVMPTFKFFKDLKLLGVFSGLKEEKLESHVKEFKV